MKPLPDRDALRASLSAFDPREKQIVGALFALMVAHPERVREREWITEQFTRISAVHFDTTFTSGDLDALGVTMSPTFQTYLRDNVDRVLNATYALFAQVATELQDRDDASAEHAIALALGYFEPSGSAEPD